MLLRLFCIITGFKNESEKTGNDIRYPSGGFVRSQYPCLQRTNSANASLLGNFEIVATSIIALAVFREVISQKLWLAIFMVTVASIILSFEGMDAFSLNAGSLFVPGACICWGFENNCTKIISNKTSAYYSIAPFLGVAFSMVLLQERPAMPFYLAMAIMVASTVLMVKDTFSLQHMAENK